jgi:hypothetical protein
MTRRLVMTHEAAGHPFRRSLPPPAPATRHQREEDGAKLFLLSFAAFFTCFYTFLL